MDLSGYEEIWIHDNVTLTSELRLLTRASASSVLPGQYIPPSIHRPLALPRIALKPGIRRAINPPAAMPIRNRARAIVASQN
jgi:hypothetical protein